MRTFTKLFFLCLPIALFGACDEPAGDSFVYGTVYVFPGSTGNEKPIHGSLSKSSGADFYGDCEYKDGKFSFKVGHASPSDIKATGTIPNPIYLSISGITGPDGKPVEGLYDPESENVAKPGIKTGTEFETTFTRAKAQNANDTFVFESSDGDCKVNLFAVPKEGEVILEINKEFEYYVDVYCTELESIQSSNSSASLNSISAQLYFDNCS